MIKELIEIKEFDNQWSVINCNNIDERNALYLEIIKDSTNWKERIKLKEHPFLVKKKGDNKLLIKSRGVTGTISVSGRDIQVSPKFLDSDEKDWKSAFIHILEYMQNKNRYLISNVNFSTSSLSLFNYIADIFLVESRKLQDEGLPRRYEYVENNLAYLKGKYDYKKITNQILHPEKLPVKYSEYSEDTVIARTFKVAAEILSELVTGNNRRKKLLIIVSSIQAKSIVPTKYEMQTMKLPPAYSSLDTLLNLSKMIVERESISFNSGNYRGNGLLWATAPIYEIFLKAIVKSVCRDKGWFFSDSGIEYTSSTSGFDLKTKQKKIFPDIQIYNSKKKLLFLFDAKYKVWDGAPKRSDIYQMIAYASSSKIEKVTLVYPSYQNISDKILTFSNMTYPSELRCCFINIIKMKNQDGFTQLKADFENMLN